MVPHNTIRCVRRLGSRLCIAINKTDGFWRIKLLFLCDNATQINVGDKRISHYVNNKWQNKNAA